MEILEDGAFQFEGGSVFLPGDRATPDELQRAVAAAQLLEALGCEFTHDDLDNLDVVLPLGPSWVTLPSEVWWLLLPAAAAWAAAKVEGG